MSDVIDKGAVDLADELSSMAQRLVAAARRLLGRHGFDALTVEAVAAEAGTYRDAVRYHFGSKAALVAAVVDALAHDQSLNAVAETRKLPPGERVGSLVASDRKLLDDREGFRDFFGVLPHVLIDDDLRTRVATLYDWYRDLYADAMAESADRQLDELRRFASLMVAMIDGLAVQKLLAPDDVDLESLLALWESIIREALADGRSGVSPSADDRHVGHPPC